MRSAQTQRTNYKWWAFLAIAVGTFVSVLDFGSTLVALPTIAEHFQTDLPTVQWVMVGYALTISALLLPMGRLSDILGRKQVYITGFSVFVIGAAAAGASPNMTVLILARVLMGCGAAMTQGIGLAIITSVFPGNERGKALGLNLSVVGVGSVAGPALGGLLVGTLDWRWVFFISVPAGIVATIAPAIILAKGRSLQDRQQTSPSSSLRTGFDWLGVALSAGMLVSLLMVMTLGPQNGWTSPPIIGTALSFVALLGAFMWWELHTPTPLLDLRLFKVRVFSLGISASFISFLGGSSVRFLMPFYLQKVLGYSPTQVGLILVPSALCMIVMAPLSGRFSDRYGWRKFNVGGMAISAAGLFLLSRVGENSSLGLPLAAITLQSIGMGMFEPPNNSSMLGAVEQRRHGVVASLFHLTRNSASIIGVAVATAIVTGVMASMGHPPSLDAVSDAASDAGVFEAFVSGLRVAYLVMGCLLTLGIVVSFLKGRQVKEALPQRVEGSQAEGSPSD